MPELDSRRPMYYLAPLVNLPDKIALPETSGPNSMYALAPMVTLDVLPSDYQPILNGTCDGKSDEDIAMSRKLLQLSIRQEAVLLRLKGLQQQLKQLKPTKHASSTEVKTSGCCTSARSGITCVPDLKIQQVSVVKCMAELRQHIQELMMHHSHDLKQESNSRDEHCLCKKKQENLLQRLQELRELMVIFKEAACSTKKDNYTLKYVGTEPDCVSSAATLRSAQSSLLHILSKLRDQVLFLPLVMFPHTTTCATADTSAVQEHHRAVLHKLSLLHHRLSHLLLSQPGCPDWQPWQCKEDAVCHDVVVRAHPRCPPYSLLAAIAALRAAGFTVLLSSALHSSLPQSSVSDSLRALFTSGSGCRSDHHVVLTVVWCDVQQTTLMVSPLLQCPVLGEPNMLRYLSRLLPASSSYQYESEASFAAVALADAWLDRCTGLVDGEGAADVRTAMVDQFVRDVERMLQSSPSSSSDPLASLPISPCAAAAVWSALRQVQTMRGGALLPGAVQWLRRVDAHLEVTGTARVLSTTIQQPSSPSTHTKPSDLTVQTSASPHLNRGALICQLDLLGIKYQVKEHASVMTVEQLLVNVADMPGLHMKNLLLVDKKTKKLFLVAARHNAKVKLNSLSRVLGCKELRFVDPVTMQRVLGVLPGHVTVYALVNDRTHVVTLVLDESVRENLDRYVNFHPMENTATLGITAGDLLGKFLCHTRHVPVFVPLETEDQ